MEKKSMKYAVNLNNKAMHFFLEYFLKKHSEDRKKASKLEKHVSLGRFTSVVGR
jgi:hypothetical protein